METVGEIIKQIEIVTDEYIELRFILTHLLKILSEPEEYNELGIGVK